MPEKDLNFEALKNLLVSYYSTVCPIKEKSASIIAKKFLNRQEFLFEQLERKYDFPVNDIVEYVFVKPFQDTV